MLSAASSEGRESFYGEAGQGNTRPSRIPSRRRLAPPQAWNGSNLRPFTRFILLLANLLPQFCFNRVRTLLWRAANIPVGARSLLMGPVNLSGDGSWSSLFSIGEDTFVSGPLRIDIGAEVRIGNRVNIGHDCALLTVEHDIGPASRRAGELLHGPITIGDGVWIASRVTIVPGVTIGAGAIIAAGSVVTSDVAPNTVVGGVPAQFMRDLDV